jgi:hypothetical protein
VSNTTYAVTTANAFFRLRQGGTFRFISFDFAAKPQLPQPALSPSTALGVNSVEWGEKAPAATGINADCVSHVSNNAVYSPDNHEFRGLPGAQ